MTGVATGCCARWATRTGLRGCCCCKSRQCPLKLKLRCLWSSSLFAKDVLQSAHVNICGTCASIGFAVCCACTLCKAGQIVCHEHVLHIVL
jgi:hypothetical protein